MADNFRFAQLQPFSLSGAGAVIGDTSITLKSMLDINGNAVTMAGTFGTIGFGTLNPGAGLLEEQIAFTGLSNNANGTTTLTGVKSVTFVYPYTQTTGLSKTHAGAAPFVISNTSGFYDNLTAKADDEDITGSWIFPNPTIAGNPVNLGYATSTFVGLTGDQTIAGVKTFTSLPVIPVLPLANTDAASKKYVDDTASFGAPFASTTVAGIVEEATQAEVNAGTAVGATGARLYMNPSTGAVNYKNGIASKAINDADTTQTIAHGLGKVPKKVSLYVLGINGSLLFASSGTYNGTTSASVGHSHTASIVLSWNSTSYAIGLAGDDGTNSVPATNGQTGVVTVDATNISIAWTKHSTNAPTGTISFMWEVE